MDTVGNSNQIIIPKEIKNLVSGGIAGMVAKTIVAPIDRIKILYQVTSAPFRLRDIPQVVLNIIKEEGASALWKGNTATMIRVFPYAGIQFMVFNRMKGFFLDRQEQKYLMTGDFTSDREMKSIQRRTTSERDRKFGMSTLESLIAGSTAGAVSVLCTYPLDLTRAQLAVLKKQKMRRDGFVKVLVSNYTSGGARGLFIGITPTLMGMLPYAGIAFSINEQAKRQIYKLNHRDPTVVEKMICGGISGLFAQSLTYPFEVTRRRMQTLKVLCHTKETAVDVVSGNRETKVVQDLAKIAEQQISSTSTSILTSTSTPRIKSPSMLRVMKQVFQEQGLHGFFKGLSMNWVKGPVSFAISFTTFDLVKEYMDTEEVRWNHK